MKYRSIFTPTNFLLLLIVLVAAVLRIYHLSFKSISIDESIGWLYVIEPIQRVIIMTINDVHPPLFYILHHFWIKVSGTSEAGLRSISVFFAILSVGAIYHLGKMFFDKKTGLIAAFLLALSPWHIWISQNARSNSTLLFFIILSIYTFYQILHSGQKKWFFYYTIVTLLAIYLHYFGFMMWMAQNFYVLLSPFARSRFLRTWLVAQIAIFAGYLFWLPLMISQFLTKSRPLYKTLNFSFAKNLFDFLNHYSPIQQPSVFLIGELFFMGLIVTGTVYLIRNSRIKPTITDCYSVDKKLIRYLALFIFVLIILLVGAGFFFQPNRTMGMLREQISSNTPVIFANTVKPYHKEQLQSLVFSFNLSAAIGGFLLLLLFIINRLCNWILFLFDKINALMSIKENNTFSKTNFFLVHSFVPLFIAGIISLKSPYLLLRNMIILAPIWFLTLAYAITQVRKSISIVLLSIVVFFALWSLKDFEKWMVKNDWRQAASVAKENIKEGDIILLEHLFGKKPFFYYGLKTVKPLRRVAAREYLATVKGDVFLLYTYARKRKWYSYSLLNAEYEKVNEWVFTGSTNIDDMRPIDGVIRLFQFKKPKTETHDDIE